MAHADYDCCAICDRKMAYNGYGDAQTKKDFCSDCLWALAQLGVLKAPNVAALLDWMGAAPVEVVKVALDSIGYHPCFYDNAVDRLYHSRLLAQPDAESPMGEKENAVDTMLSRLGSPPTSAVKSPTQG